MDFIFMLTRNDKTVEDAGCLVDQVCDLGVTHIGFKDLGVPMATMKEVVGAIRRRGGVCYLEVVSTTPAAVISSLHSAAALGVDRVLGGTDLAAARASWDAGAWIFLRFGRRRPIRSTWFARRVTPSRGAG